MSSVWRRGRLRPARRQAEPRVQTIFSAFGFARRELLPNQVCSVYGRLCRAPQRQSDLREFADTMYLLMILRFLLGLLSGIGTTATAARPMRRTANAGRLQRGAGWHAGLLHDCVSVDDVLTERPWELAYRGRGTFEKANHLLRCALGNLRRLSAGGQPCAVRVPTVSPNDPRLRRG